jgi:hypothetical protein
VNIVRFSFQRGSSLRFVALLSAFGIGGAACDFTFAARPPGYIEGRSTLVTQGGFEVVTDGIVAPNNAKNVAAILDLRNAGRRGIVVEEIDLVGVDGVAMSGSTERAKSARAEDAEPKAPGLETLPLRLDPGASGTIAVRWRLDHDIEVACADRCTIVVKHTLDGRSAELRVDLLDDTSKAARPSGARR